MILNNLSKLFLLFAAVAFATPRYGAAQGVRKEWRTLSNEEKAEYIRAVTCLHKKPSKINSPKYPGAVTRFDDIVLGHILHTPNIHFNGQFLIWHRYFTWVHEKILREECGYKGYQPFWDSSLDVPPKGRFLDSPVFAAELGFGGNGEYKPTPPDFKFYGVDMTVLPLDGKGPFTEARGNSQVGPALPTFEQSRTGGGCLPDGPFKDLKIRLGPANATGNNERCLVRDLAPTFAENFGLPDALVQIQADNSYENITGTFERLHGVGHAGVGGLIGDMINIFSSTNDPLFFLHHANIDRVYWNWQIHDRKTRFSQVEGFAYNIGPERVTLGFMLDIAPLAEARPVGSFLDIGQLGYSYQQSY